MPWCCGAGDANFDYCDDCVATFPECERCGENLDTPMLEIDMYCRKCWDYYKQPEGWGLE
jgi:primosomal protein N'